MGKLNIKLGDIFDSEFIYFHVYRGDDLIEEVECCHDEAVLELEHILFQHSYDNVDLVPVGVGIGKYVGKVERAINDSECLKEHNEKRVLNTLKYFPKNNF
ncbi:MAG: hypothetical protein V1888_04155 [archaeon]